jgi:hypothetical protein
MKYHISSPALLLVTMAGLSTSAWADIRTDKTTDTTVTPNGSTTQETTRTAVLPDPTMDRREGKIARFDVEAKEIHISTALSKGPIAFSVNPATKFIDLDGKTVAPSLLKIDTPVEIKFAEDGNTLIAATVVVQRVQVPLPGGGVTLTTRETLKPGGKVIEESSRTTTVVHSGTITTFDPGVLTVKVEGTAKPVTYQHSKTTTWVNAAGQPVAPDLIKQGLPVKVQYSQRGDILVADQVIVMVPQAANATPQPLPAPAPGPAPKAE